MISNRGVERKCIIETMWTERLDTKIEAKVDRHRYIYTFGRYGNYNNINRFDYVLLYRSFTISSELYMIVVTSPFLSFENLDCVCYSEATSERVLFALKTEGSNACFWSHICTAFRLIVIKMEKEGVRVQVKGDSVRFACHRKWITLHSRVGSRNLFWI